MAQTRKPTVARRDWSCAADRVLLIPHSLPLRGFNILAGVGGRKAVGGGGGGTQHLEIA